MAQISRQIKWDELEAGMIIEEVTELSIDYASLDPDTLKFVQTTFKGAQALVAGEDGHKAVPVEELQPFDTIQGLTDIAPDLTIAVVVPGSPQYLEQNGMLSFRIGEERSFTMGKGKAGQSIGIPAHMRFGLMPSEPVRVASPEARKLHQIKKAQVKFFLDTIETALAEREMASDMVEDMLDQGRRGLYSSKGVEKVVDEIIGNGCAEGIKALAGLRGSDQTYTHCTDMAVILEECYVDIVQRSGRTPSKENERFALLSGFLHDIGKSEVPKEILESVDRYAPDSREMIIMRNHTTYGIRILEEMGMSDGILNVASYHHVKMDTTLLNSYPDVSYQEVLPFTRLASVVDVYQALIGNRRYKRNWVPGKAVEYLAQLESTEFDPKMLGQFFEVIGKYPVGSLVRLNTGDLAFVLMIGPKEHPERPIVTVVENAAGEMLTHHSLLDMMLEEDIGVEEVVDHYNHYNESEDQAHGIFRSIRIN